MFSSSRKFINKNCFENQSVSVLDIFGFLVDFFIEVKHASLPPTDKLVTSMSRSRDTGIQSNLRLQSPLVSDQFFKLPKVCKSNHYM